MLKHSQPMYSSYSDYVLDKTILLLAGKVMLRSLMKPLRFHIFVIEPSQ